LWGSGEVRFDTLYSVKKDTVYITRYVPGNTIRETVIRTDTITKVNTAELKACQLALADALRIANDYKSKYEVANGKAHKRFWILIGLAALVVAYVGWKFYKQTRKLPSA